MRIRALLIGGVFGCAITMAATNATALTITPADALSSSCNPGEISVANWGNDNQTAPSCPGGAGLYTSDGFDVIAASGTMLQYKQDFGNPMPADTGPLAGSYSTTFNLDQSGGTISYVSGAVLDCPSCYLVVKDGFQDPSQYLFDLGNWNGADTITLSGFWLGSGAISHVSLYSAATTTVPDGGSVALLLGMALMGLAGVRRMMN
jgi:hypothetical protein